MQERFFLFHKSNENSYILSSTIDNFRLEAELEDGRELKVVTFYGEGITLQELDELKEHLYQKTGVTPPETVQISRQASVGKVAETDYTVLLDSSPEKFFKQLVLTDLDTARSHNVPQTLQIQLQAVFNYLKIYRAFEKYNCFFCAIDSNARGYVLSLNYYRGVLFADESHVYGIIRFDNLGRDFLRTWNSQSNGSKLYVNRNNKMLLVKRFSINSNGVITTSEWQHFFTRTLAEFARKYQKTLR